MIGKQDSYLEKREKSRHICQQCDLVEELSNEDLENVAGGALSGAGFNDVVWPPFGGIQPLYGIGPIQQPLYGIGLIQPLYGIWPIRR